LDLSNAERYSKHDDNDDDDDDDGTVQVRFSLPCCHSVDWKAFIIVPPPGGSERLGVGAFDVLPLVIVGKPTTHAWPGPAACWLAGS